MKLLKTSFYNPFFIDVENKRYEIRQINFFNKNGVICSTKWFGSNNEFNNGLELPTTCSRKRTPVFTSATAFIIKSDLEEWERSRGDSSKSWFSGLPYYDLYIPAAVVGLHKPTAKRYNYDSRHFVIRWESDIKGVTVESWYFVDEPLRPYEESIKKIGENLNNSYYATPDKIQTLINELQAAQAEYSKEYQKMLAITPDEILQNLTEV